MEIEKIKFYAVNEAYGEFSNFALYPIKLKGKIWKTTEHYFQAQKFIETHHLEEIQQAKTPKQAASMGRDRKRPLRQDWEKVKDDVMRKAVLKKFETHSEIQEVLLYTGDEEILENAPGDYYWGCGKDGSGKNMLGKILMEVREKLRS
ncbi:MAG: NADAR family protein [Rivularia sp. ALOHA_DT_140]|nr:NADAR family protein [Rivularia sp. ALOHA_DT_140]